MKILTQFLKFSSMMMICGMLMLSCTSDEPEATPEPKTPALATVEGLDSLSDHLQFLSAEKKQGKIPSAPTGASSLKFSIKDTLHLVEGVFMPVKFLHDELTNVEGVFIQVRHFSSSTNGIIEATHHYDVPELPDAAGSDSVSIIMVGFDPEGLVEGVPPAGSPFTFEITIKPYDSNDQPLDETVVPVIIEEISDDHPNSSGSCGLVLPEGEYWLWSMSYIPSNPWDGDFIFFSDPSMKYGGQSIKGCCANGESGYGASCLNGDPKNEKTLFFPTYYQIAGETFIFNESGTFERITLEKHGNPDTDNTDFCGVAYGAVTNTIEFVTYEGNWTIQNISIPPGYLENPFFSGITYTTRDRLSLQGTSSTPPLGGFGNPGGIIHLLDCKFGLILIQTDNEGFGRHLYKFYFPRKPTDEVWFPI
jgi:hypothetical protein